MVGCASYNRPGIKLVSAHCPHPLSEHLGYRAPASFVGPHMVTDLHLIDAFWPQVGRDEGVPSKATEATGVRSTAVPPRAQAAVRSDGLVNQV